MLARITSGLPLLVILLISSIVPAWSDQHLNIDAEIKEAWASVFDGHVNDGTSRAGKLLAQSDPKKDAEAYWKASATLVEIFQELENDKLADQVLNLMVQNKIGETPPHRLLADRRTQRVRLA